MSSTEQTKPSASTTDVPGWLNRTVLGIGIASLCSDGSHEMAITAMPVFLASIGANAALLGIIEGLADGLSSFAKLLSGFTATNWNEESLSPSSATWSPRLGWPASHLRPVGGR